jgi:hypothetical protein
MSISVFPVPSSGGLSTAVVPITVTAPAAGVTNRLRRTFLTGVYTISCVNTTNVTYYFFNGETQILTGVTSSGTATINLATQCDSVLYQTNTGSNIVITFTQTSTAVSSINGTLDILTTSQTYNQTGNFYITVIGGGGGGGGGSVVGNVGGPGPRSGGAAGLQTANVTVSAPVSVTVGAAGNAGPGGNPGSPGGAGGTTIFGAYTSNGGNGGSRYNTAGTGGTPNGVNGSGQNQTFTQNPTFGNPLVVAGNINAGSGGAAPGSSTNSSPGGAGGTGAVYILRGIE